MKRGDVVSMAVSGDLGKPRPAVVIQADAFNTHTSLTLLPITSTLVASPLLRVPIAPTDDNGLMVSSQIMVDKAITVRREKIGPVFGRIDATTLLAVERSLAVFLGIAK